MATAANGLTQIRERQLDEVVDIGRAAERIVLTVLPNFGQLATADRGQRAPTSRPRGLDAICASRRWTLPPERSTSAAKARLSEVVKLAESEGPQDITLHGRSVAVVVSRAAFEHLSGSGNSLVEFMRRSP